MAYVHGTVNEMSQTYLLNEKRYNYTTPKSFLELIDLFSKLLKIKDAEIKHQIKRLDNGLMKLIDTNSKVEILKIDLAIQEKELKIKNEKADQSIARVNAESDIVQKQKSIAAEEEKSVRVIQEDVSIKAKVCEEDLKKAQPALDRAMAALNILDRNKLTELKSFGSPPEAVVTVCSAVLVLYSTILFKGKVPKVKSYKEYL